MKKKKLLKAGWIAAALLLFNITNGQNTFQKAEGGGFDDEANAIYPTSDGGYVMAGRTDGYGVGNWDLYLTKLDAQGNMQWSKIYGDVGGDDIAYDVKQTTDGGYIVVGRTDLGNGGRDAYVIKTDALGNVVWDRTIGNGNNNEAYAVEQTTDGGYIVTGYTRGVLGGRDVYIMKLNSAGTVLWANAVGGGNDEVGYDVQQTTDGGYIVTGYTRSFVGGGRNVYLLKFNSTGNVQWSKIFSTGNDEYGEAIRQTADGGYIITGFTDDFNPGNWDVFLIKTNSNGNITWSRAYGGDNFDAGYDVLQTSDGGYVVTGVTASFGAGGTDAFLLKTDNTGGILWSKMYGGGADEEGLALQTTADGGFVIGGSSLSYGVAGWDFYIVKTDASGSNSCGETNTTMTPINYSLSTNTGSLSSGANNVTNPNTTVQNVTSYTTCICLPTANFSSTAPQCTGLSVDFINTGTSGTNYTYSWNFGNGATPATSTMENPTGIVYATAGSKQVWLVISDGVCKDSIMQTIDINQTPAVSFTSTAPQCAEANVDFTNTGATGNNWSYSWDLGQDAQPSTSNAENPTGVVYTSGGTKTVTLTISDQFCTNTATMNITINDKPVADFTSTAPQCTGLSVDFMNTGTTGINYSWNFGSGATPATSTMENPANVVYSTAGTKNIELIVNNGFCSDTMYQTITIHQTPTVNFATTAPQCVGTGVNFTNAGTTGANWQYTWDFGQDAQPAGSNSENPTGIIYTSGGTKSVTLIINDQNCSNSLTNTININALPMVFAGNDTTICANDTIQIGTASVSGYTYQWYPSNNLVISNPTISNPDATPVSDVTTYIVTVTDQNNCVNTDSVIVTMLSPILANAGVDVEICRYDSIQIGAALIEGQHYVWTPSKGIDNAMSPNPIVSPDSTTTYTVTVSNEYNCPTESDQVTVIVHQLPLANAGIDDTITIGSQTQLIATGGVQYSWSPAYGLDNIGIYNPIASPESTTEYIVQVIDIYGCINYDTVIVNVLAPEVWVPTAFTPDDVYNNIFYVRGQGVQNFKFRIFNRNGELLFISESMDKGWDGTRQLTGEKLPQGAYIYDVQGVLTSGEVLHKTGVINLIR